MKASFLKLLVELLYKISFDPQRSRPFPACGFTLLQQHPKLNSNMILLNNLLFALIIKVDSDCLFRS